MRGAVHTIRDMGELSFVVLRKRDGLLQCIFEEGTTDYAVKDLREEMAVEISGVLEEDARAPHGIEIRAREVKVFGRPYEAPPLPIGKWKLNTSLEQSSTTAAPRSATSVSGQSSGSRKASCAASVISCTASISQKSTPPKIGSKGAEGGSQRLQARLFPPSGRARTESAVLQTDDGRCV